MAESLREKYQVARGTKPGATSKSDNAADYSMVTEEGSGVFVA